MSHAPLPPLKETAKDPKLSTLLIAILILIAFATTTAYYLGDGLVAEQKLATIPRLVLYERPHMERHTGKSKSYYYYVFSFYEQKHPFTLRDEYYSYSNYSHSPLNIDSLKAVIQFQYN